MVSYFEWREVITVYSSDDQSRNGITTLSDKLAERQCKISTMQPHLSQLTHITLTTHLCSHILSNYSHSSHNSPMQPHLSQLTHATTPLSTHSHNSLNSPMATMVIACSSYTSHLTSQHYHVVHGHPMLTHGLHSRYTLHHSSHMQSACTPWQPWPSQPPPPHGHPTPNHSTHP